MEKSESKTYLNDAEAEEYRKKIAAMVGQIEGVWILKAIHNFIAGMTKEGD